MTATQLQTAAGQLPASEFRKFAALARLEFAEVLRSRWLWFTLAVYSVLGVVFVLVGLRESNILGFTGMGRVLMSMGHALVLLLPLLGLTATGQVINRARDDGSLELWFSQPISRSGYFTAVSLVRLAILVLPLLLLLPALAIFGRVVFGQVVPWAFLLRTLAVCICLLMTSVAVGLMVSTYVRNQAKALMLILACWALGVALMDFALVGLMLQWQWQPQVVFTIAALNPVQCARLALLAGADPELAQLGPVGFFLANRLGATGLLIVALAWPTLLAAAIWLVTRYRFAKGDLV